MQTFGSGSVRSGVYDGKIAGLYDLEQTLGVGHFATVKLARHVFTGEKVAVKVIDKTKLDEVSRAHLFQEVRCMKLVQHPHVVRLYEVIDTQTKLYLILELGDGGDLYDYIMKHEGGLSEHLAREYFRQIVRAISYCHKLHVVHRDLKPENVLFFEKLGIVKLTDFGFSNKFCPGQKLETSCGSLAYSAPEILLGDSYDAPAVDVWSLGVILYMLVCGHPPFQEANDSETLTMIMDCKYTTPAHVSNECRDLIARMLLREPEKRATLAEIATDRWLTQDGSEHVHVPEYLPLVSRQQVSDDDHALIIQKMINGNIATKEEILEALDKNEYNHITATYFLLAERRLKITRQETAQAEGSTAPNNGKASPKKPSGDVVDAAIDILSSNLLAPPSTGYYNSSRTGVDGVVTTTGRSRKCSIVQEEDDDEDDDGERDDGSLNRRGSKSEGRINITVQDRLAETERLKKECAAKMLATDIAPTRSVFDGICNVKVLTASDMDPNRLGRRQFGHKPIPRPLELQNNANDAIFRTIVEPPSPNIIAGTQNGEQANSEVATFATENTIAETKFLTDSSTITIPISSQTPAALVTPPKYKTMPSPERVNTILPGAMCLNEIFEEGTDIGSSDTSATTTPRPVAKHANFTNNRSASQSGAHAHRRSKFNKSRTASCSSSDDDDSENRKKRAHKIVDSTKPIQTQRRDSNDDSSDSQDPSNPTCGASGSGSTSFAVQIISDGSNASESTNDETAQTGESNTNGRQQKSIQGFRRHRAGRRRTGETRLRESQSLNRITEVQESEMPISNTIQYPNRSPATLSTSAIDQADPQSPTTSTHSTVTPIATHKTPKLGFGARLLQGFKRSESNSKSDTVTKSNEPKNKHNNNNNNKNNWNGNGHHISSAESNETLNWIKHSKPPLRVKAHQRLKNLKCLVDIFS
ncbi:uncharacterized protein LOC129570658 [Sitodiplosis mosellana]|uniref:uncharacterized protein LOC129570658 n=1 Tax=Sitodiplosis mosellana TaxID=263140 RepID=UPI002444D364|nr:uncharacterized protein LOC129570658 [Sitodiplosis mosellana]XP_055306326.1 uncharacterized protein LOC129570658 [Sitodiplosis mosellana]